MLFIYLFILIAHTHAACTYLHLINYNYVAFIFIIIFLLVCCIWCREQRKNFIVQWNMFLYCVHDNKTFEYSLKVLVFLLFPPLCVDPHLSSGRTEESPV